MPATENDDLLKLMASIRQMPVDPNSVTLPTKSIAEYREGIENQTQDFLIDPDEWNRQWDAIEKQMKMEGVAIRVVPEYTVN